MIKSASTNMVAMSKDKDETGRDVHNTGDYDVEESIHHSSSSHMICLNIAHLDPALCLHTRCTHAHY